MPLNTDNAPLEDELNPLSNPLLASHMGRWAEVYFTNPPEHRDRAVLDLLRELEAEAEVKGRVRRRGDVAAQGPPSQETAMPAKQAKTDISADGIPCVSCGYVNSRSHIYCGMCGVPLTGTPQKNKTESVPYLEEGVDDLSDSHSSDLADAAQYASSDSDECEDVFSISPSLDDSALPGFARQHEAGPSRQRLYVGLVLAMLLGGLIYVGKRGSVFFDDQRSPDAKIMPAAQPVPDAPAAQDQGSNSRTPVEQETKQSLPQPMSAISSPKAGLQEAQSSPASPPALSPKAHPTIAPPQAAGQGSAEDLIEAQRYLAGGQRSAGEALPLLWNAVAKGNAAAMVALSDLYLRGNGVGQNCDQARVLLDSAAKKGAKAAGERLRHMQAFGCQ